MRQETLTKMKTAFHLNGYFSTEIEELAEKFKAHESKLISLCKKYARYGREKIVSFDPKEDNRKGYSNAVFSRITGNFEAIIKASIDLQYPEVRIILRTLIESQIRIIALARDKKFLEKVELHSRWNRKRLFKNLLKHPPERDRQKILDESKKELDKLNSQKCEELKIKKIAEIAKKEHDLNTAYSIFSESTHLSEADLVLDPLSTLLFPKIDRKKLLSECSKNLIYSANFYLNSLEAHHQIFFGNGNLDPQIMNFRVSLKNRLSNRHENFSI